MTDDVRFERQARDWLELGPVEAPSDVVQAAFLEINTTRQERYPRVPWRLASVGSAAAVTTAAVLLLVAGAALNPLRGPAKGPVEGLLRPAGAAIAITPTWVGDDGVALTIRGAGLEDVAYWRATTFDRMEAKGWSQTDRRTVTRPAGSSLLEGTFDAPGTELGTRTISVTVTPGPGAGGLPLVAPGVPVAVDRPVSLALVGSAGFFGGMELDDPESVPTYRVTGTVDLRGVDVGQLNAGALRAAGTDYPPEVVDRYLQLEPRTLGPNALALRDRIVAAADSRAPFDLAQAAETELRSARFTYSTDVRDHDCDGVSTAECLATYREGYCLHFATTMAAILRDLGVPTRLVEGFLPGEVRGDVAVIRNRDAHAWVEVYFPGSGWVTFDPTAATTLPAPTPLGS
jgi:transglutaminase-like putative cysteine protease